MTKKMTSSAIKGLKKPEYGMDKKMKKKMKKHMGSASPFKKAAGY